MFDLREAASFEPSRVKICRPVWSVSVSIKKVIWKF